MGKYAEDKIRAVRMDMAEDSLDKVEDKICELSSSLDDVRQAVLDLEIKVNQQACKGERTEDKLPLIPNALKLTPGSVIRADGSDINCTLIANNGCSYISDNQWTVRKPDGSKEVLPSRRIEYEYRLVYLAPEPELPPILDASKLTPGSMLHYGGDHAAVTVTTRLWNGWMLASGGTLHDTIIVAHYRLVYAPEPELPRIPYASKSTIAAGDDIRRSYAEPEPELRPQVGASIEQADVARLHIDGMVIRSAGGSIAVWRSGPENWAVAAGGRVGDDRSFAFPLTVLHAPEPEPEPELPRPQVGEIVERANAERLHVDGLAIIDSNLDIARWYGEWSYTGNDVGVDDDDIWWPVTVLLPS